MLHGGNHTCRENPFTYSAYYKDTVGTKNLKFGLIRPKDRFTLVYCLLLVFLGTSKYLLLIGVLLVVYLHQFDHEGLIHAVSSEQLMLRCVCYLNSEAFIWAVISEDGN